MFCGSLESLIARATPQSEGNQIVPLNPRKRSRGKPNTKGSGSRDPEETVMDWVDRAGHKMPGTKLTAISSCLADWFRRFSRTKVVIFTQFLGMASILSSMCQKNGWGQSAFSRIFRIRQQRNVEFVRIVVQNSIDDRIQLIQNEKTDGIEQVIGSEVLTSRDTLANLCTVLGIEQDDSMERGYRFISDKEAERRHEAAPVTVFDGETGKAPGQAEADTCASAASNINGLADSRSNPPGVGNVKDTESTESSADKVGDVGTINDGETCEIASIGGGTLAKGTKSVIANGTGEPVGPSQATREVGSDVSRDL
ncbi:hypothetical protein RJZ90_006334 [Blastomyces dermatitidis]